VAHPVFNAQDVCCYVRLWLPEAKAFHRSVDALVAENQDCALAFAVCKTVCAFCGSEDDVVYPIPTK